MSSLINNFISPLINTVTFVYKWALDLITQSTTTTMVSTPTKKKRGRDDKKLSPLSSQPRHLWDSPSSRNKKSTKTSSVTLLALDHNYNGFNTNKKEEGS